MSRRVVVVLWFLSSSYDEGEGCDGCGGREERGVVRHFVLIGSDFEIAASPTVLATQSVLRLAVAIRARCA